ncbi:GNAT family N-acetyltransferase [Corynebacterium heidelbergense]|uniref:N-acetyltransferase n=1 Tax=Corynebacterium heidelbergense TaxID=2055947 RepID=A0A364V978_9CORY|nr:GNAT family N-acetyltransferase [Corynebacterium heidelbergense]RAV33177.1 N-acetyltransferase [Corynebacterium heidelbergense]WCZ37057.1 Putative phosphinothricin acetyltransferase YwnH [Corynebacterium heidelbergense]
MASAHEGTPSGDGGADRKVTHAAPIDRIGNVAIRAMDETDYPQVREILQQGMDTGEATFEGTAPDWPEFIANRIPSLTFVAEDDNAKILGWVSASPSSHRHVFHGVVEDSIYVAKDALGKGIAGRLLDALMDAATAQGYWALHSSIFPENTGSVKLHKSRGFEEVGVLHRMAQMEYGSKKGMWRDLLKMEHILGGGPAHPSREQEAP